jgi:hypothetical protein
MRRRKQTNPDIVWGAVAIAEACGKEVDPDNPNSAFYLAQALHAEGTITKVGRLFAGSRERLRQRFGGGTTS